MTSVEAIPSAYELEEAMRSNPMPDGFLEATGNVEVLEQPPEPDVMEHLGHIQVPFMGRNIPLSKAYEIGCPVKDLSQYTMAERNHRVVTYLDSKGKGHEVPDEFSHYRIAPEKTETSTTEKPEEPQSDKDDEAKAESNTKPEAESKNDEKQHTQHNREQDTLKAESIDVSKQTAPVKPAEKPDLEDAARQHQLAMSHEVKPRTKDSQDPKVAKPSIVTSKSQTSKPAPKETPSVKTKAKPTPPKPAPSKLEPVKPETPQAEAVKHEPEPTTIQEATPSVQTKYEEVMQPHNEAEVFAAPIIAMESVTQSSEDEVEPVLEQQTEDHDTQTYSFADEMAMVHEEYCTAETYATDYIAFVDALQTHEIAAAATDNEMLQVMTEKLQSAELSIREEIAPLVSEMVGIIQAIENIQSSSADTLDQESVEYFKTKLTERITAVVEDVCSKLGIPLDSIVASEIVASLLSPSFVSALSQASDEGTHERKLETVEMNSNANNPQNSFDHIPSMLGSLTVARLHGPIEEYALAA